MNSRFLSPGGRTNTGEALSVMRNLMFTSGSGDRADVRNVGIVFMDAESVDPEDTFAQAVAAHEADIDLIAFGLNIRVSRTTVT